MTEWSLPALLGSLHDDVERHLGNARKVIGHPVEKGDAAESLWISLFERYLPTRYRAQKAFVVDSEGQFSEQIDIVIYDRQYSPLIFELHGQNIIPAESVYAIFEAKQSIDAGQVAYAQKKAASVRKLARTTLPVPHAGGEFAAKEPHNILAGLLTFESEWKSGLGDPLVKALATDDAQARLDIGCVAAHGIFESNERQSRFVAGGKPVTAFLLELIARLQELGTVPRMDIRAYAAWLGQ